MIGDTIEFYFGERWLVTVDSSHAPDRGDLVNIRKATYEVVGRTYTIDHADEARERGVACIITLATPSTDPEPGSD